MYFFEKEKLVKCINLQLFCSFYHLFYLNHVNVEYF